jgi:hypothetical protein
MNAQADMNNQRYATAFEIGGMRTLAEDEIANERNKEVGSSAQSDKKLIKHGMICRTPDKCVLAKRHDLPQAPLLIGS